MLPSCQPRRRASWPYLWSFPYKIRHYDIGSTYDNYPLDILIILISLQTTAVLPKVVEAVEGLFQVLSECSLRRGHFDITLKDGLHCQLHIALLPPSDDTQH